MANSLTFGTIQREIAIDLGDVDSHNSPLFNRYSNELLMAYANDVLGELFSQGVQMAKWNLRTVANQSDYSYPTDCLAAARVWFDDAPLILMTKRRLYEYTADVTGTGTPQYYYMDGNYFWLHPIPEDTDALADTDEWRIELWGIAAADKEVDGVVSRPITDVNSPIIIENSFADILKMGILAKCKTADGDLSQAGVYQNRTLQRMEDYRKVLTGRQGAELCEPGPEI